MNISMSLRSLWGEAGMNNPAAWVPFGGGGHATSAGVDIGPESAMHVSAYFSALRNIGDDTACMPLGVYQKTDKGREDRREHSAHNLLNNRADRFMGATNFRASWMMSAPGWGGAYALIERTPGGQPQALHHINSAWVTKSFMKDGERWYVVEVPGQPLAVYPDRDILHLYGVGPTGYGGYSIAGLAAECLGLSVQAEKFGAKFYANSAVPSVALLFPESKKLNQAQVDFALQEWELMAGGASAPKARGVRPLFNGMDIKTFSISPNDSQFLETREFQVKDFARIARMPLHMLMTGISAPAGTTEQLGLEYITYTLQAWLKRAEDEYWMKLLSEREQDSGWYCEHNVDALLRGDSQARANFYRIMFGVGGMTLNQIKGKENLPSIGPLGDQTFIPVFQQPIELAIAKLEAETMKAAALAEQADALADGQELRPTQIPPSLGGGNERDNPKPKPGAVVAPILEAALLRTTTKSMKALAQAMKTHAGDPGGFQRWKKDFFGRMGSETAAELRPAAKAMAALLGKEASPIMNALAEFAEQRVEAQAVMASAPGAAETWADNIPAEVAEIIELLGVDHATD
jgi:HK97 family phage portal protein